MYMLNDEESYSVNNSKIISRKIPKRKSSIRREKLNVLGEEYHSYIDKYHGFFTLTCQLLNEQFDKIFTSQQAKDRFFEQGVMKYNNNLLHQFIFMQQQLVIDIENVLVRKIELSDEKYEFFLTNRDKYYDQIIIIDAPVDAGGHKFCPHQLTLSNVPIKEAKYYLCEGCKHKIKDQSDRSSHLQFYRCKGCDINVCKKCYE